MRGKKMLTWYPTRWFYLSLILAFWIMPVVLAFANTKASSRLPAIDELVTSSLNALKKKIEDQEKELNGLSINLKKEEEIVNNVFDVNSYLNIKFFNNAPAQDYRLDKLDIVIDGVKYIPENLTKMINLKPGCHTLQATASYTRLKNDIISRFKVNRTEETKITSNFIAQDGYQIIIEIEGFEAQNSLAAFFKTPKIRLNKSVKPNFIPGRPVVSLNEILNQGRLKMNFITEDNTDYEMLEKSISIDGLKILLPVSTQEPSVIFDAPILAGKHRVNINLVYVKKRRIKGGPEYKFNLTFDREINVLSGETTLLKLKGMPKNGFDSDPYKTIYATAESQIISTKDPEVFIEESCQDWALKAVQR